MATVLELETQYLWKAEARLQRLLRMGDVGRRGQRFQWVLQELEGIAINAGSPGVRAAAWRALASS